MKLNMLKFIGFELPNENKFKKRLRLHHGWWRAFVLGEEQGKHPNKNEPICNTIKDGEKSKKNFISETVAEVVEEVLEKRKLESSGAMEEDRLYNNLLSSQPLCFNFFAPLYKDKKLALNFLQGFYPELTEVTEVFFEHANSRNKSDNSAYDVAFEVKANNQRGLIGFECKYTDSFSPTVYDKTAYRTIYSNSDILKAPYEDLIQSKYNQIFRNQLIGESFKQDNQFDFAYTALFCHHDDESAIKTADEYRQMLREDKQQHFQTITYRNYFEQVMKLDLTWEMREYFMLLWARYCGLKLSQTAYEQFENQDISQNNSPGFNLSELQNKRIVSEFEGGVIYTAEKDGEKLLVLDESTAAEFLSEEERDKFGSGLSIFKEVENN